MPTLISSLCFCATFRKLAICKPSPKAPTKGIRERSTDFRYDNFANLSFVVPPLDEQKQIVGYLGSKNREIEGYIAAKRGLLVRLKELSAAVISQSVTRGLNREVETKKSGVEWLGDVPEHWEVKPLRLFFSFEKGRNSQQFTSQYVQGNLGVYPVYSGQTENNGVMGRIDSFVYDEKSHIHYNCRR